MDSIQNFVIQNLVYVRAVHVVSAMIWSFYFISAMWHVFPAARHLLSLEGPEDSEMTRRAYWALEQYDHSMIVEHIAFVIAVCAGGLMFLAGVAGFSDKWFAAKMVIVLGLFIPATISGAWYNYVKAPRLMRNREADPEAYFAYRVFVSKILVYSTPLVLLVLGSVMFLALTKPF